MALNRRERLLIGVLAVAGVGIVLYTLVHDPLTTRRAEAREKLESVESQLLQEQKKLAKEGNLEERRAKVIAREQVIDSWVPGKNSAGLLIWHLSQAELISGARIREIQVGQQDVVSVADPNAPKQQAEQGKAPAGQAAAKPPADSTAAPAGQAAEAGGQEGEAAGTQQGGQGTVPSDGAMTTLVVIPLTLRLEARFAEHLIFNQYMEDAPLFLSTLGLDLKRKEALPIDRVGKLLQSGNPWLAGQVLAESPAVSGEYRIHLYFKANKPGPSTDGMHFESQPGRVDPFVMAGVDEFIRLLQGYFADQNRGETAPLPPGATEQSTPPLPVFGQLG